MWPKNVRMSFAAEWKNKGWPQFEQSMRPPMAMRTSILVALCIRFLGLYFWIAEKWLCPLTTLCGDMNRTKQNRNKQENKKKKSNQKCKFVILWWHVSYMIKLYVVFFYPYPWPSRLTSSVRNRSLNISSLLSLSTSSSGVLHWIIYISNEIDYK